MLVCVKGGLAFLFLSYITQGLYNGDRFKAYLSVVTHVFSCPSIASGVDKIWPFGMSRSMADHLGSMLGVGSAVLLSLGSVSTNVYGPDQLWWNLMKGGLEE